MHSWDQRVPPRAPRRRTSHRSVGQGRWKTTSVRSTSRRAQGQQIDNVGSWLSLHIWGLRWTLTRAAWPRYAGRRIRRREYRRHPLPRPSRRPPPDRVPFVQDDRSFGLAVLVTPAPFYPRCRSTRDCIDARALHAVLGNVWEWVQDCWRPDYSGAPTDGTPWRRGGNCHLRMLRGGSWWDLPQDLRAAFRNRYAAGHRADEIGFRVARTLDQQAAAAPAPAALSSSRSVLSTYLVRRPGSESRSEHVGHMRQRSNAVHAGCLAARIERALRHRLPAEPCPPRRPSRPPCGTCAAACRSACRRSTRPRIRGDRPFPRERSRPRRGLS